MRVRVKKHGGPLPFGMKYYADGEEFDVANERDANILIRIGRVEKVVEETSAANTPRRRYRRAAVSEAPEPSRSTRVAGNTTTGAAASGITVSGSTDPEPDAGEYKTRDMKAE